MIDASAFITCLAVIIFSIRRIWGIRQKEMYTWAVSFCTAVMISSFIFTSRVVNHYLAVTVRQQWGKRVSFFPLIRAEWIQNRWLYAACFFIVIFILLMFGTFRSEFNRFGRKLRFSLRKDDIFLKVRYEEHASLPENVRLRNVSARLSADDHLFILGELTALDENADPGAYYIVRGILKNGAGRALYMIEDQYPKRIIRNQFTPFAITVLRINRYVNPSEIAAVFFYLSEWDKTAGQGKTFL